MQLGVFLPNANNGFLVSEAAPQYMPTYALNKAITQLAERLGLDFAISMVKYRGYGGSTEFWDYYTETLTLTAALAEATSRIQLVASIGILSVNPAVAARMINTIDDISGGRVGVNIVTGGWKPEYTQMGVWPGDNYYTERYDYARDYVTILKELWATGRATFKGRGWNLEDCQVLPKPSRMIPLVNAGQSPKGVEFTAEHCDYLFVFAPLERLTAQVKLLREYSAKYGRKTGTYALFTVIMGETDEAAKARAKELVDHVDQGAINRMVEIQMADAANQGSGKFFREGIVNPPEQGNPVFMGFPVIAGSHETVAREFDRIAEESQIDGVLLVFLDYLKDMQDFADRVMPLMKSCADRAKPAEAAAAAGR
jgi:pyrimidine oxygenase